MVGLLFLYLDVAYPKEIFTIVIWGTDRPKFGHPERIYRDKNVCATGTITIHLGKPQITAGKPSQIQIQK